MHSDDEDSHASQPSSPARSQTSADEAYFVRDSTRSFDSRHCKFSYGKTFRSLEAKATYENNKTYIRAAKLKTRQYAQITVNRMCCICSVKFFSRNELFKHLNNGCVGAQGKSTSSFSFTRTLTPAETVLSVQEAPTVPHIAFSQNDVIKEP